VATFLAASPEESKLKKAEPALAEISQTHHEDFDSIISSCRGVGARSDSPKEIPGTSRKTFRRIKKSGENFEAFHPALVRIIPQYCPL
jgi:hypothetical protein